MLVLFRRCILKAVHQASKLIPNEAFDLKSPPVVLSHDPVKTEDVAQVLSPALIIRRRNIGAAILSVAMQRKVRHQFFAPRSYLACFQEMVQPTRVMCHGWTHKLCVAFG